MKAIWAVACSVLAIAVLWAALAGCAAAPAKPPDAGAVKPPAAADGPGAGLPKSGPGGAAGDADKRPIPVPASGGVDSQYRIGAEDVLHVSVWENKELSLDAVVRPDGKISLPLVQDVQAEGLTAGELADVIHQKLLQFVKDPQVSVIVLQVNAAKIYVLGSVARPGPFPLRGDMSVLQALSLAGGFTTFASPKNIRLVRGLGTKQEVRKINYYRLLDEKAEGNFLLKPGDTIVVP